MLLRCEAQYQYRYVQGIKSPPSGSLIRGSAMDDAFDLNFTEKLRTGRDEPEPRLVEAYAAGFASRRGEVDWKQEEEQAPVVRDAGIAPLKIYRKDHCPSLTPAPGGVQPDLGMVSERLGIRIVQYGDLVTADGLVIDRKTSKKSPPTDAKGTLRPSSFDHEMQVVSQRLGYEAVYHKRPKAVRLDYLVMTKDPKVVPVTVRVGSEQVALWETMADRLERRLQWLNATSWAGAVPNRAHNLCSKRWCGYWTQCEKDYGGKVRE